MIHFGIVRSSYNLYLPSDDRGSDHRFGADYPQQFRLITRTAYYLAFYANERQDLHVGKNA